MADVRRRLPAEWEPQAGIQLTWPHAQSDWGEDFAFVEPCFIEIAAAASRFEKVLIVCPDPAHVRDLLACAGTRMTHVVTACVPSNDTWARDHGPITVVEDGRPYLMDFTFNGWGGKFAAELDNAITAALYRQGAFGDTPISSLDFVLEGGSIDSDGCGTILTTSTCLLTPTRNPGYARDAVAAALRDWFGAERLLWLDHGYLAGDDTDSHVDTLARFCDARTIAYVGCEDPDDEHFEALSAMEAELGAFRTADGAPYNLVRLPMPSPHYDSDGQRLPATYANFLIINGAVLVPVYGDAHDVAALDLLRPCFPGRELVAIDCRPLILQHGSLHCVTMQIPEGVPL